MSLKKCNLVFAFSLFCFFIGGKHVYSLALVKSDITVGIAFYFALVLSSLLFLSKASFIPFFAFSTLPFILSGEFNSFGLYKVINVIIATQVLAFLFMFLRKRINISAMFIYFSWILGSYVVVVLLYMIIAEGWFFGSRVVMGLNGPITFARFSFLVFLIIMLFGVSNRRAILAPPYFAVGLSMGSKGPFISIIISFVYFFRGRINVKRAILVIIAIALVIWGVDFFSPRLFRFLQDISYVVFQQDTTLLQSEYNSGSFGSRLKEWAQALEIFKDYPMGVGPGQWAVYGGHLYPHNLFLELLTELGIVGVFLSILIFYNIWSIKDRRIKSVLIFLLVNSLFSGSLVDNILLFSCIIIGRLSNEK